MIVLSQKIKEQFVLSFCLFVLQKGTQLLQEKIKEINSSECPFGNLSPMDLTFVY